MAQDRSKSQCDVMAATQSAASESSWTSSAIASPLHLGLAASPTTSRAEPLAPSGGRSIHLRLALASLAFALVPPFVLSRLRTWALRACGVRIGSASFVWGRPTLLGQGPIASRLRIGRECGFNDGCLFDLAAPVTIGDRVAVGHQVRFLTRRDPAEAVMASASRAAPIEVGDGAWLGARCTILAGVTIGAGSVIGAGVTVRENVAPHTLVTGSQNVSLLRWR
jgi:maltose O-acetyltransferase